MAIGILAVVTALVGCIGSCRVRCCLSIYAVLAVLAAAGQLGLVLYLFISPAAAVDKLSNYQLAKKGQIK